MHLLSNLNKALILEKRDKFLLCSVNVERRALTTVNPYGHAQPRRQRRHE
jgi:hypothetical protein